MLMLSIFPSQEGPQQLCTHAQKTHRNTVDGKSMSHRAYSFIAFQRGAQTVDRLHNQYVSRLHESRKNFGYHWYHLPFWFMPGVARTHWDNSDSCHQLPSHLGWTRWLKAQCIWYYLMHWTCWNNKVVSGQPSARCFTDRDLRASWGASLCTFERFGVLSFSFTNRCQQRHSIAMHLRHVHGGHLWGKHCPRHVWACPISV